MSRRRLLVALVTVAVALIVVLGIAPLIVPGFRTGIQRSYFLLNTFNGVVGFFLLISGFAIGMTVIYNDLDSGAAVGIFVKPVSRLQYTVGKSAATLIVLALLTALLTLLTVALLLINGGTGYDYGAVVTNLLAGTANILVLVVLVMALASAMNNVVAAIIGFVLYEVFGAVSTLHALVANHTLTASPWAQIINVLLLAGAPLADQQPAPRGGPGRAGKWARSHHNARGPGHQSLRERPRTLRHR